MTGTPLRRIRGPREDRASVLATLRAGVDRLEGAEQEHRRLPTLPALGSLLPGRSLRRGGSYAVDGSIALALALLAGPSAAGSWVGVVGMPTFGAQAAAGLGVDLTRAVLVPAPGTQWLQVVAALLDAFDVVLVRPPAPGARAGDAEARRLAARVREREAVLIVLGPWAGCEARLTVTAQRWQGLGRGHGHLASRQVAVTVTGRGSAGRPRSAALWLPGPSGAVEVVNPAERDLLDLPGREDVTAFSGDFVADVADPGRRWGRAG